MPDPKGTVSDHQHLLGLAQAAGDGFAIQLRDERLQALARGHKTPFGDRGLSGYSLSMH